MSWRSNSLSRNSRSQPAPRLQRMAKPVAANSWGSSSSFNLRFQPEEPDSDHQLENVVLLSGKTVSKSAPVRSPMPPGIERGEEEVAPFKKRPSVKKLRTVRSRRDLGIVSSTPKESIRKKQHIENKKTRKLTLKKKKSSFQEVKELDPIDQPIDGAGSDSDSSFCSIVENTPQKANITQAKLNQQQQTLKRAMHNNIKQKSLNQKDDYADVLIIKQRLEARKQRQRSLDLDFDDESKLMSELEAEIEQKKARVVRSSRKGYLQKKEERRKLSARNSQNKITMDEFKARIEAKYKMTAPTRSQKRSSGSIRGDDYYDEELCDDSSLLGTDQETAFSVSIRGQKLTIDSKLKSRDRIAMLLSFPNL